MSKSTPALRATHPGEEHMRAHSLRGAVVLLAAAGMLVAGSYYVVLSLTGPDGLLTHMASQASADVEGRTLSVAADNY